MAHDDVNDLKRRVTNQSVQIVRLDERVRSLTKERDHWIAEAGKAREEARKAEDSLRAERVPPFIADIRAQPAAVGWRDEPGRITLEATDELLDAAKAERMEPRCLIRVPYHYPQSWWQRIIGRLFA